VLFNRRRRHPNHAVLTGRGVARMAFGTIRATPKESENDAHEFPHAQAAGAGQHLKD
jgi:hypothetical protein